MDSSSRGAAASRRRVRRRFLDRPINTIGEAIESVTGKPAAAEEKPKVVEGEVVQSPVEAAAAPAPPKSPEKSD